MPDQRPGCVEVAYTPGRDPAPDFLDEEQQLLNSLARLLEAYFRHHEDTRRLSDAERRFQALFDNEVDCVKVLDADRNLVAINPAGRRLLDCGDCVLEGSRLDTYIHPDDRAEYARLHQRALAGQTERGRYRVVSAKGVVRHLDSTSMPLPDGRGGMQVLSITRDLTRLQQEEEKFRHLLDSSPDAMVIADAEGRIRLVNRACETTFGYAREELIGQPVEILIPDKLRTHHVAHRQRFARAPQVRPMGLGMNLRGRRKDGSEFPVEIALGPIHADNETLICATVRDLTGIREFETALREMANTVALHTGEVYFRELVKFLSRNFGLHTVIIGTLSRDGKQVNTIAAAAEGFLTDNFSYPLEHTPCAKVISEDACFYEDDIQGLFPRDEWFREQNARGYAGVRLTNPQGEAFGIISAVSRTPLHNLSVIESFFKLAAARASAELDRIQKTDAVAETEQRYRLAEAGTADGLWDLNLSSGTVYYSPRFAELLGLAPGALGDTTDEFWRRMHPADQAATRESLKRHLERNEAFDVQYRLRHADGHYRWFRARGMAVRDATGKPARFTGGLTDITVSKRQQLQLGVENLWLKRVAEAAGIEGLMRSIADSAPALFEDCLLHVCIRPLNGDSVCFTAPHQQDMFGDSARGFARLADIERQIAADSEDWRALQGVSGYERAWIKPADLGEGTDPVFFVVLYPPGQRTQAHERRFIESATRMLQLLMTQARTADDAEQQRLLFRNLFESTPEAMVILDRQDCVVDANPKFTALFQYSLEEARGRPLNELIVPLEFADEGSRLSRQAMEGSTVASETFRRRKDGTLVPVSILGAPITAKGSQAHYFAVYRDESQLHEYERRLEFQNRHDALTSLPNRYEFEQRLAQGIRLSRKGKANLSVIYFDLDQFKIVNDTLGHQAGDRLLKDVTRRISGLIKPPNLLARLGGDEFAIMLVGADIVHAEAMARDIRERLSSSPFTVGERMFNITASFGVVEVQPESDESAQDILALADSSCFIAKERGRNRVQSYDSEDVGVAQRRQEMDWVARLNKALAEDRFVLYHQKIEPIGNDGEGGHSELLLRLLDDEGRNVPPAMFIPPAERYNLMPRVDRWVLKTAFTEMARRGNDWQRGHHVSVNISGNTLSDEGLTDYIAQLFRDYDVLPEAVCFEITETAAIGNFGEALRFIELVRRMGCEVALDDFGSGLSSFRYLKEIAPDYLKIDGSFIREIVNNSTDRSVVEAINRLGKIIGIRTVAEFVEDEATLEILRENGVDYAQGYGIHRPELWMGDKPA